MSDQREQWIPMSEQVALDVQLDMPALTQFLKEWQAIEDAKSRMPGKRTRKAVVAKRQKTLRLLYKDRLPIRAVILAMKIVRKRDKLATHPKEPMPVHWQDYLEQTIAAAWGCQG